MQELMEDPSVGMPLVTLSMRFNLTIFSLLKEALQFISYGRFFNPARIDVTNYRSASIDEKNNYVCRADDSSKSVCTAVVPALVTRSSIVSKQVRQAAHTGNSYYFKRLSAMMFQQEYQLVTGKLGMVLGFETIKGDYIAPETGFTTRPSYPNHNGKSLSRKRNGVLFCYILMANFPKRKNVDYWLGMGRQMGLLIL